MNKEASGSSQNAAGATVKCSSEISTRIRQSAYQHDESHRWRRTGGFRHYLAGAHRRKNTWVDCVARLLELRPEVGRHPVRRVHSDFGEYIQKDIIRVRVSKDHRAAIVEMSFISTRVTLALVGSTLVG
jgi:hypothetical protein